VLHAVREQAARGAVDLVPELGVGGAVALVADDERLALAEARDGAAQVLADRLAEERDLASPVGIGERCVRHAADRRPRPPRLAAWTPP
jgi:hypothetical protein